MFKNKGEKESEGKGSSGFKPKNTGSEEKPTSANNTSVEPEENKKKEPENKNTKPTTNTTTSTVIHHAAKPGVINKQTREAMLKKLGLKKVKK
jgi:hypothetical protein